MLEIVSSVLDHYNTNHPIKRSDKFPVRTTLLRPLIEQRGVVDKIKIFKANVSTKNIVTQVEKYKGEIGVYSGIHAIGNIYFAPNHSQCWQRFGVCKEMFHCMIDRTEDSMVSKLSDLLKLFELLVNDTSALIGDYAPLSSEQRAELMALETLCPVEYRQHLLDEDDEKTPAAPPTQDFYMKIARDFKIPIEYARLACQPTYIRACIRLRGRLLALS